MIEHGSFLSEIATETAGGVDHIPAPACWVRRLRQACDGNRRLRRVRISSGPTRRRLLAITLLLLLYSVAGCSSGQLPKEREDAGFMVLLTGGDRLACCGIVSLSDRAHLLLGRTDYLNGVSRAWLGQVSAQGSQIWAKELPLPSSNSGLVRGASSPLGSVYAVGHTVGSSGRAVGLVVRVEPSGTIVWTKSVVAGIDTRAVAVTVSRRAIVMVVGVAHESGGQGTVVGATLTPEGDQLWQQVLLRGADLEVTGVRELETDGYLVHGSFGVLRVDALGAQQWHLATGEALAALEMPNSDLVIATAPRTEVSTTFQLRRLTARGEPLWSKSIRVDEACGGVAGLWLSSRGQIVAAGSRCRGPAQIWVGEISERGEVDSIKKLGVRAGASAFQVEPVDDTGIVAAGMFAEDSPDRGKGWLFRGRLGN